MKQFITTKFVLALKDAFQKGNDVNTQVMEKEYDKFTILLLTDTTLSLDRVAYRNSLIYTREELTGLVEVSGKKYDNLSLQSH
jgi:hypothetical protein